MFEELFKRNVQDYIRSNHSLIQVIPGKCRFNFRCHNNTVHDAIEADDSEIAMTVYFEGGDPCIHFLNIRGGKYVDNTLGHWSKCMEYYLIRTISKEEFFDTIKIFCSYRKYLKRMQPWYVRMFCKHEC